MKAEDREQLSAYQDRRANWWLLTAYTLDGKPEHLWYQTEESAIAELPELVLAHIKLTDDEGYESEMLDGFLGAEVRSAKSLTNMEWFKLLDGEYMRQICIGLAKSRTVNTRAGTSKRRRKC